MRTEVTRDCGIGREIGHFKGLGVLFPFLEAFSQFVVMVRVTSLISYICNIPYWISMFHAPMGRFQLQLKLELPLFSGFRPVQLVVFVLVSLLSFLWHLRQVLSPGLVNWPFEFKSLTFYVDVQFTDFLIVGCRSFFCRPAWAVDHWSSNYWLREEGQVTEEISTPNKTCRRCRKIN